ncbi:MAG: FAD-binding oxidoreductase [Candidatus Eremiobacteraeota bacterium]|nr:FAD-binding oxidoreductase [Candidatus Eremiobacteraeota bacterium]
MRRSSELRALNIPIADELAKRSGSRPRVRPAECEPYAVAGVVPTLVFSPRTVAEASKIVTALAAEGASIAIRGAGTKSYRPPHPHALDVVLESSRCAGISNYTPADLTMTVAAGTPLHVVQETLRPYGQFFPVDPPFAAQTTIGGTLSAGSAGALRQRYGAPRDNVLGMRVCLGDGAIAFTGARVVKSVAGYDIPKLFVGASGTLGFIGEVTLKVAPLPRCEAGVAATFVRCEEACEAARRIAASPLLPMATTLHDGHTRRHIRALGSSSQPWTLLVRCGGSRSAVLRQQEGVIASMRACGAATIETLDADRLHFCWQDVVEAAGGAAYPADRTLVLAIGSLPTQVADVCASITALLPAAEITAHPATGIVYAHVPWPGAGDPSAPHERRLAERAARSLLEQFSAQGHHVKVLSAPVELGTLVAPLSQSAPVALMRRVKAALDPNGTFDPGRFVAGI